MAATPDENSLEVKLAWTGFDDEPILAASHIISQYTPDGLFLVSFGMVKPPVMLGTAEEKREILSGLEYIPVETLVRIALTPTRMREFIKVMQDNLRRYEKGASDDSQET